MRSNNHCLLSVGSIFAFGLSLCLSGCATAPNNYSGNIHYTKQQEHDAAKAYALPQCAPLRIFMDDYGKIRKINADQSTWSW